MDTTLFRDFLLSHISVFESQPQLRQIPAGCTLRMPASPPKHAHFLLSGLLSTSIRLKDGSTGAVRFHVRGDFLEISHLFGVTPVDSAITVIVPCEILRLPYPAIAQAFRRSDTFRDYICAVHGAQWLESERLVVCNQQHDLEKRLASYLISVGYRTEQICLPITQERLASQLGVQRSSVVMAAGGLRKNGLIDYRRALIRIIDRDGLAAAACECSGAMRKVQNDRMARIDGLMAPFRTVLRAQRGLRCNVA